MSRTCGHADGSRILEPISDASFPQPSLVTIGAGNSKELPAFLCRMLAGRAAVPRLPGGKVRRVTEYYRPENFGEDLRRNRLPGALLILTMAVGLTGGLAGCGVVAAPVRITSAVVKVVPVAGDVVAAPLDVTADVID